MDLKLEADQEVDLETAELGLCDTLVVGDVIIVGAAPSPGGAPKTIGNTAHRGLVRAYDAPGKRLWTFDAIPRRRVRHLAR